VKNWYGEVEGEGGGGEGEVKGMENMNFRYIVYI